MSLDKKTEKVVDELIECMKNSEQFITYEKYRKMAVSDPELSKKIKRTRVIREQLNEMSEDDRNDYRAEMLEKEYDELQDATAVHLFSIAELELCEMYREIIQKLVVNLDLDL